jgi:hypothetical protein
LSNFFCSNSIRIFLFVLSDDEAIDGISLFLSAPFTASKRGDDLGGMSETLPRIGMLSGLFYGITCTSYSSAEYPEKGRGSGSDAVMHQKAHKGGVEANLSRYGTGVVV